MPRLHTVVKSQKRRQSIMEFFGIIFSRPSGLWFKILTKSSPSRFHSERIKTSYKIWSSIAAAMMESSKIREGLRASLSLVCYDHVECLNPQNRHLWKSTTFSCKFRWQFSRSYYQILSIIEPQRKSWRQKQRSDLI